MQTAAELFSQKGFDATSVDSIAKTAGVNKALIYYYFKNKADIIHSLFADLGAQIGSSHLSSNEAPALRDKIASEISDLEKHKKTLALMITEALKLGGESNALFSLSRSLIEVELKKRNFAMPPSSEAEKARYQLAIVHEFFTGVIPVIAFVTMRDKFAAHWDMETDALQALFLDALEISHLESHLEAKD